MSIDLMIMCCDQFGDDPFELLFGFATYKTSSRQSMRWLLTDRRGK